MRLLSCYILHSYGWPFFFAKRHPSLRISTFTYLHSLISICCCFLFIRNGVGVYVHCIDFWFIYSYCFCFLFLQNSISLLDWITISWFLNYSMQQQLYFCWFEEKKNNTLYDNEQRQQQQQQQQQPKKATVIAAKKKNTNLVGGYVTIYRFALTTIKW